MARLSITISRHWPGPMIRVTIVVVYVLATCWAPGGVPPLGIGAPLRTWLGVSVATTPIGPPTA
jgi:hypothetical protein